MIYTGSDPHKTTNSDHTADGWYYANKNGEVGPYNLHDLKLKFAAIPDTDGIFVWRNGMSNWQRISDVPEFNERMQPAGFCDGRCEGNPRLWSGDKRLGQGRHEGGPRRVCLRCARKK
jgi:GYF domain 2